MYMLFLQYFPVFSYFVGDKINNEIYLHLFFQMMMEDLGKLYGYVLIETHTIKVLYIRTP